MNNFIEEFSLPEKDLPYAKEYSLHQIKIRFSSSNSYLLDVINQILGYFSCNFSRQEQPDISFTLKVIDSFSTPFSYFPANFKLVSFDDNQKYYFDDSGRLYSVCSDKFIIAVDLKKNKVQAVLSADYVETSWLIFEQVIYPVTAELLKQLHLFNIHCAAAAKDGTAILFPAQAKSGKSTLSINLLKAGFDFLSDDICFIRKNSSKVIALGFPEPIKIWDNTIKFFPELSFLVNKQPCIHYKKILDVEKHFPDKIKLQAVPGFLILPKISNCKVSKLYPVSKTDTLVELIPQSVMVANKTVVGYNMEILTALVNQCECYRLEAGTDVLNIPKLIEQIL